MKIHRHRWKEPLKINKVTKFENDMLKTNEDMHLQVVYRCLYRGGGGGGQVCAPSIQCVKFCDFAELYTSNISLSYLASLLILRRSFK